MTESEIIQLVKRVVAETLAPILMSTVTKNQDQFKTNVQRFPSDPGVNSLRNIQPFGLGSRAPSGTSAIVIPVNGDASHLNVVGHFDSGRPTMNDGETILYDAHGHMVYLSESKMQFGSKASANPMMLGDLTQTLLSNFLELFIQHSHAAPGYPPTNAADATTIKASPVDDGTLVSGKAFTEK